jgi:hypothetical protein
MLADVPTTSSFFFRIESIVGPAAVTDTKHNIRNTTIIILNSDFFMSLLLKMDYFL